MSTQSPVRFPWPRAGLAVFLGMWLAGSAARADPSPTPRHRHKSTPSEETPTPTPSPSASPTPAASPGGGQPSSADEAAPSKASPDAKNGSPAKNANGPATVSTIEPGEIEGFDADPEPIKKLLLAALELTKKNLTYAYGSNDPANGGMDCSGTIFYLLKAQGFTDVPRQANEQYEWVRQKSHFYAVLSKKQDNAELREMRPGDLLFWTGTYRVDRDPPVTHTMIYLGKRKKDGARVMFGASDGRPYNGERRNGVSVFDFRMPAAKNGDAADAMTTVAPNAVPDFSGYGPIPGMTDLSDVASRQTESAHGTPGESGEGKVTPEPKASPTPRRRRHSSNDGS